jgi:metallo-beta-lactamase family protein
MEITFLGAAGCVTGSKFLIRLYTGEQILLDCGLFQGLGEKTWGLNNHFEFNPAEINYLILSHAHIDHSGLIPKLVKEGFSGKIFCSNATFDLCSFMLPDSGHIQEADVRFVNKRKAKQKKELLKPLYTLEDAKKCLAFFKPVEVNTDITINPNFSFSFIMAISLEVLQYIC